MEEMRDGELERSWREGGGENARAADAGRDGPDGLDGLDEQEEVRRRAYERWLARGDAPGDEVEDWLWAEREVRSARVRNGDEPPADVSAGAREDETSEDASSNGGTADVARRPRSRSGGAARGSRGAE